MPAECRRARVTLQTIADELGISRMTVSNAFSRPDQLSADLRDRILATATELGYTGPDPAAGAGEGNGGHDRSAAHRCTAGRIHRRDRHPAARGHQRGARRNRAAVSPCWAPRRTARWCRPATSRSTAHWCTACSSSSAAIDWLRRRKVPLVYRRPGAGDRLSVSQRRRSRRRAGCRAASRRPRASTSRARSPRSRVLRGRRRRGGSGRGIVHAQRRRMEGWLEALDAVGVEPVIVNAAASTEDAGQEAARWLLELPATERPLGGARLLRSDRPRRDAGVAGCRHRRAG